MKWLSRLLVALAIVLCGVAPQVSQAQTTARTLGYAPGFKGGFTYFTAVPSSLPMANRVNLMGYNGYAGSDGVDTDSNTRVSFYNNSGATVNKLRTYTAGWTANGTNEADGFNTVTIEQAIEYPAGTFTRVLYSTASSYALLASETKESDEVTLTTPIPSGAQAWVRTYVLVTSGQKWVQGYAVSTTKGEAFDFSTGVNKVMGGTITNATASATRRGFGPIGIKATNFTGTPKSRAWVSVGDSIEARAGAAGTDSQGNFGWNDRAIAAAGFSHATYAISGTTAFGNVPANFTRRLAAIQAIGYTDALIDWSNNDLSGSQTYAQITANITSIVASFNGIEVRVHWVTPLPRVTGTYLTAAGQVYYVPNGGYTGGPASRRAQVADFLRANTIGLAGVFDAADAVDVNSLNVLTRNGGYWISGNAGVGASNSHLTTTGATTDNATGDGQHPSDNFSSPTFYGGHPILQDALLAYLLALP